MAIYHCTIKIISRSSGRSAVASAAYRAGEKLYNEETGITHDFTKKGGIVYSEIMLPANAPEQFKNREILWNDVQKQESRADAQFAREVEVALPVEMSREQQIEVLHSFIQKNFVDGGMIADFAIHDKGTGNPHAHILLTVRGFDEQKHWEKKQKTVFANRRDEEGRAVYDPMLPSYDSKNKETTEQYRIPALGPDGKQKTRVRQGKGTEYLWEKISIPVNDWNDRSKAEIWRASWADMCNQYLTPDKQIDHRSFERQGIEREPTIHEGHVARGMEQDGKIADRCEINREIRNRNLLRDEITELAQQITDLITQKAREIYERIKELRRSFGVNPGDAEQAGTDKHIDELKEQAVRKEELNERIKRILGHRSPARRNGGPTGEVCQRTQEEIQSFIDHLNAKERTAEKDREARETERRRLSTERERRTEETSRNSRAESRNSRTESARDHRSL